MSGGAPAAGPGLPPAGLVLGLVAALAWASYVVTARHGALSGLSPVDLAVARYVPSALILFPLLYRRGLRDLAGIGWRRAAVLAVLAGPLFGFTMAWGLTLAPVSHGGVIGPAALTLTGAVVTAVVLREHISRRRRIGLVLVVAGLVPVAGGGTLTIMTPQILAGDLLVIAANASFAIYGVLLKRWGIDAIASTSVVALLSALCLAVIWPFTIDVAALSAIAPLDLGLAVFGQGILAGSVAVLAYAAAVARIGPARAAVFPSLVPGLAMVVGAPLVGEAPTALQFAGLAVVSAGLVAAVGLLDRPAGTTPARSRT